MLKLFTPRYYLDVKITVPDDYHTSAIKYVECFSLNKLASCWNMCIIEK